MSIFSLIWLLLRNKEKMTKIFPRSVLRPWEYIFADKPPWLAATTNHENLNPANPVGL
jgi:hypothetical protein